MKRTYYYRSAIRILQESYVAAVATASADGEPWNTPIITERDTALNLYWFSDRASKHARNVRENGRVSIVFYDSTVADGQGRPTGLYIQAFARELHEIRDVRRACALRKTDPEYPKAFTGDAVRRVYEAIPERFWINDVQIEKGVFIRDYRVELSAATLKRFLKKSFVGPER